MNVMTKSDELAEHERNERDGAVRTSPNLPIAMVRGLFRIAQAIENAAETLADKKDSVAS